LKTASIIINARAGSVADPEGLAQRACQAFEEAGVEVRAQAVDAPVLEQTLEREADRRPDALIVGGGDGTARTAARYAIEADAMLGVIPMGTMNLLARDLGIPADPDKAVCALAAGGSRTIDAATVNDTLYLHSSAVGLIPRLGEVRERARSGGFFRRPWRNIKALAAALRARRNRLHVSVDGGESVEAASVIVASNSVSSGGGWPGRFIRPRLDAGTLAVYRATHVGWLGTADFLLMLAGGGWESDPHLERIDARTAVIESSRERVRVSSDGEIERMDTPLRFEIKPRALRVLAPRDMSLDAS